MNKKKFAIVLKSARESAGINKCELSRKTGFSVRVIQYWEQGKQGISLENADKILKALGVELTIGGKK